MATRIRDGVPGKEKVLPRQVNIEQRRASTTPSASPSKPIASKSKPSTSDKEIPNYLKPTRSRTTVDQPTQSAAAKKTASAAASEKALLARRRSFGKNPPPVSQLPKTNQSANPKEKSLHTSTSFSGSKSAGTNPQKGTSNRIVKTAATAKDVVKKPSLYAKSQSSKKITKKNGESSAEGASRTSSVISSSPERVHDPEILNVPYPQEDDPQSSFTDEEVTVNALSSHDEEVSIDGLSNYGATADVVKEEEEQKTETPVQDKQDIQEQEDNKIIKSPNPEVHKQNAAEGSKKTEEADDQNKPSKETSSFHLKSQQLQEKLEDNTTEPVNENLEVKAEHQGKEEVKDATPAIKKKDEVKEEGQVVNLRETKEVKNIESREPKPQEEKQSEKELKPEPEKQSEIELKPEQEQKQEQEPAPASEETQTIAAKSSIPVQEKKETPAVSNDVSSPDEAQTVAAKLSIPVQDKKETSVVSNDVSAPEETQTVAAKSPIPVQGKKEMSAVSNDVIEETASKLQEQRRNRVRALAGAFETVIARQDK